VSVCVHALPSLHAVPFVAVVGAAHTPVDGLQVPATLHIGAAGQTTGLLPTQTPPWQLSACVQALPSLHAVPLTAVRHRTLVGVQTLQTPQAAPSFCQKPLALQVWGCRPVQRRVPGLQRTGNLSASPSAVSSSEISVPHPGPASAASAMIAASATTAASARSGWRSIATDTSRSA
jgi:hypothetical protein